MDAELYPHLFREAIWPWGPMRVLFQLLQDEPPARLIASVNVVPFCGGRVVIIRLADGNCEIPGGTLEPGETYHQAAQRELKEEAGADLQNLALFGAWHCLSLAEGPYQPHLPFPEFYRVVGIGEVKAAGKPGNPRGGEAAARVDLVTVESAAMRFQGIDRPDLAELYRVAAELHARHSP